MAIAATLSFMLFFSAIFVYAQGFSVSPGDFEVQDVPPLGEPFALEKKLVIRNSDNVERTFILSVAAPPAENLRENYEAIPDNRWLVLIPAAVDVENNSSAEVEMLINMPRWENLLDRRFEAWILVERVPMQGEFAALTIVVKAWMATSMELPPPPPSTYPLAKVIIVVAAVLAAVLIGKWAKPRKKKRKVTILRT